MRREERLWDKLSEDAQDMIYRNNLECALREVDIAIYCLECKDIEHPALNDLREYHHHLVNFLESID